jgi:hypothetical protein
MELCPDIVISFGAACIVRKVVVRRIWSLIFCMAHKPYLPGINKMERERQASEINTFISG